MGTCSNVELDLQAGANEFASPDLERRRTLTERGQQKKRKISHADGKPQRQ